MYTHRTLSNKNLALPHGLPSLIFDALNRRESFIWISIPKDTIHVHPMAICIVNYQSNNADIITQHKMERAINYQIVSARVEKSTASTGVKAKIHDWDATYVQEYNS